MFEITNKVDTGVTHMSDIKTLSEVAEITGIKEGLLKYNIDMKKRKQRDDPGKLIPGVDYIKSRSGHELYTPVGIEKIKACEGKGLSNGNNNKLY